MLIDRNLNGYALKAWWARQDSNLRPKDYESPALTAAPRAREKYQVSGIPVLRDTEESERETGFEPADISLEG
jgi:hypothetical protein